MQPSIDLKTTDVPESNTPADPLRQDVDHDHADDEPPAQDIPKDAPPPNEENIPKQTPPLNEDATLHPLWKTDKPASFMMVWISWLLRRLVIGSVIMELLGNVKLLTQHLPVEIRTSSLLRTLGITLTPYLKVIGHYCALYADLEWIFSLIKDLLRPFTRAFCDLAASVIHLLALLTGSFFKGFFEALPIGPHGFAVIVTFLCASLSLLLILETIGAIKKIDVIRFSFWVNLGSSESFTIVRWFTTVCCFCTKLILQMDEIRQMVVRRFPFLGVLFRNFGNGVRYISHSLFTFVIRTPRQVIIDSFSAWFVRIKRISELWDGSNQKVSVEVYPAVIILISLMVIFVWVIMWFVFP